MLPPRTGPATTYLIGALVVLLVIIATVLALATAAH